MKSNTFWKLNAIAAAVISGSIMLPTVATAAEAALEEVVVVGSRGAPRTVADSPVPVDVLSADELNSAGSNDLLMQLQGAVPSLNVHLQPISDAASMIRPANLRGLSSDSTLVLVNGKRRHRASVIAFQGGGVNDGSQGADISVIPSIALKQVEVLRDGAAAQYGSDAVAGVMNFVLNDSSEGGSLVFKHGEYQAGDGATSVVAGNFGMPLTDAGFMNISFQMREADPTSRSVQRPDAQDLIDGGNSAVTVPAQIWGAPIIDDDVTFFFNSGLDLGNGSEVYMFGNYSERDVDGGFYYRNPNDRSGVFTYGWNSNAAGSTNADNVPVNAAGQTSAEFVAGGGSADDFVQKGTEQDGTYRLVADLGDCAADVAGDIDNIRLVDPTDDTARDVLIASDECYIHNEQAPGGYTPRFTGNIADTSFTAGVRGELTSGMFAGYSYDLSGSVGRNEADFGLNNTFNPSMGPDSGRDFSTGSYIQLAKTFNFDLQKQFDNTSFAVGYEWRETTFEVVAGEQASWQVGDYTTATPSPAVNDDGAAVDAYGYTEAESADADEYNLSAAGLEDAGLDAQREWEQATSIDLASFQPFNVGSHGFAGFSPDSAGAFTRRNYALYVDVESQVTDDLLVGGAVRYEDYTSFGDTTNYKLTFNYQMTDNVALRGSTSTGFRAPTQGQANVVNTQTTLVGGQLTQAQTLPSFKLGEGDLQPEESESYAFGLVMSLGDVEITADYFNIEVTDRIALTSNAAPTAGQITAMTAAGIPNAELLGQINYFTNDFDTETEGLDVVATYGADLFGGSTDFSLAYNWTDTVVSNAGSNTSASKVKRLEEGLPNHRATFTMAQNWDGMSAFVRTNYFGEYYAVHADWFGNDADAAVTVDAEVTYAFTDSLSVSVGGQNIFDQDAERIDGSAGAVAEGVPGNVLGAIFYETSPMGIEGAFWYMKASYNF
ncbi:MAG: TonB-dependent receptor plug domain-containing protein [Porticoccaceae bacterium]